MRTPRLVPIVVSLGLLGACPALLAAQEEVLGSDPPENNAWASLALGTGGYSGMLEDFSLGSLAFDLEASVQRGVHLLTIRSSAIAEVIGGDVYDVGLLYGRATRRGLLHLSMSAGIAYVKFQDENFFSEDEEEATVGLPLAAEVVLLPIRFGGVGLKLFGNINSVASFGGVAVVLRLGDLR